ncbi:MAG: 30S ribosomal protein S8 [Myxococcales bacterium]|nr:30S ribosomal protein S8 [Myxococcales bacterium]
MTMTDPIADYLTRIRNAVMANRSSVDIPASRVKIHMTEILKDAGYIDDYTVLDDRGQGVINIDLKWHRHRENAIKALRRESRPGQRRYVKAEEVPKIRNGHGIAIISTSRGLLSDSQARKMGVGGEYICSIY